MRFLVRILTRRKPNLELRQDDLSPFEEVCKICKILFVITHSDNKRLSVSAWWLEERNPKKKVSLSIQNARIDKVNILCLFIFT